MFDFMKNHPFPVQAWFNRSTVLTFAVPKEQLESMIPNSLELDTFQDKYGFIAIAMVDTSKLRPKGFPTIMGNDFFLIGFRIFVKYTNEKGRRLRGLYILQSATNKKRMEWLGSLFTRYKYETIDIQNIVTDSKRIIASNKANFVVNINTKRKVVPLPPSSPFTSWKEARRFAGPLPFTFSVLKNKMLIIQGVRQNWKPEPIEVTDFSFQFLNDMNLEGAVLANAFQIKNVPYHWEKGYLETLEQTQE